MEMLSLDAQKLVQNQENKQQKQTLLESLNYETRGNTQRPMTLSSHNDTQSISSAGQTLIPGQTIVVQLKQTNSVINIAALGIAGKFQGYLAAAINPDVVPFNMLQLFEPVSMRIGNMVISYSSAQAYLQDRLMLMSEAQLEPLKKGLWIPKSYDDTPSAIGVYTNVVEDRFQYGRTRVDRSFFIPLYLIFPALQDIVDMALFTGITDQIQFDMKLMQANQCVYPPFNSVTTVDYRVTNTVLVEQHNTLEGQSLQNVLMNEYEYFLTAVSQSSIPASNTTTLTLVAPLNKPLKRLLFTFGKNTTPTTQAVMNNIATIYTTSQIDSPTGLFPQFALGNVTVQIAGYNNVIDCNTIQFLHQMQASQSLNCEGQMGPACNSSGGLGALQNVYSIDISRFPVDALGSNISSQTTVLLTVQLNGLDLVTDTYATIPLTAVEYRNFNLIGYLEYQDTVNLKSGRYVV